jgi:hypothetical protein
MWVVVRWTSESKQAWGPFSTEAEADAWLVTRAQSAAGDPGVWHVVPLVGAL